MNANVDLTGVVLETDRLIIREWRENHKVIGSLGIETLSLSLSDEYENLVGREIGYVLSKDYWGKGLMPEAVNRVIKFCFEKENYDYLMCSHSVINSQSKRVIEKSGFRFIKENTRITRNGDERISLYYVLDNPLKRN